MSNRAGVTGRRAAAMIIAAAATAVLAAACGGSNPPSTTKASAHLRSAIAFSHCMRSHGVTSFPDPPSSGVFPKTTLAELASSNAGYRTAAAACQHLLPILSSNGPTAAERQHVRELGLAFAHCMRAHHINLPDPDSSGRIPDPGSLHPPIDQGSPQFQAANQACGKYRPPYMPSNAAYNSFARSGGS